MALIFVQRELDDVLQFSFCPVWLNGLMESLHDNRIQPVA